jgi:hypothetical protein
MRGAAAGAPGGDTMTKAAKASKARAGRKRSAARDLAATNGRVVKGGLLPAVQVAREVSRPAESGKDEIHIESYSWGSIR